MYVLYTNIQIIINTLFHSVSKIQMLILQQMCRMNTQCEWHYSHCSPAAGMTIHKHESDSFCQIPEDAQLDTQSNTLFNPFLFQVLIS
jgi:hypothetical protein